MEIFKKHLTNKEKYVIISFGQGRRTTFVMFSPGAYGARYDIEREPKYALFGICMDILSVPYLRSLVCAFFYFILGVFHIATSTKDLLINEQIRAKEVRVIDADGTQLGILATKKALDMAYDKGLDLVEIAPTSVPPVCRIMDYGKYRFDREKKEKEAKKKQQVAELKEVQLSCRIDTHDFETKLNHALKFLSQGNKVKVSVKFKGREMAHTEIGLDVIRRFGEACTEIGIIEKQPALDGRQMLMFLAPKPASAGTKKAKEQKSEEDK